MICPTCGYLTADHKVKYKRNREGKIVQMKYRCSGTTVTISAKTKKGTPGIIGTTVEVT